MSWRTRGCSRGGPTTSPAAASKPAPPTRRHFPEAHLPLRRPPLHLLDRPIPRLERRRRLTILGIRGPARLLGHELQEPVVLLSGEEHRDRRLTIPARPPELLQVVLDRRRVLPVDDETDIGHVEPHAEGIRADHHVPGRGEPSRELPQEHVAVVGRAQLRVIEGHVAPLLQQALAHLLADAHGRHEDHRSPGRHRREEPGDQLEADRVVHVGQSSERDVRPVDAGDDDARVGDAERLQDALLALGPSDRCSALHRPRGSSGACG